MSDIVLRIYSGSGATWGETLDYEITGVLDYTITDESGSNVDKAWFKIEDINHVYGVNISPDYDTNVQVWRAYESGSGKLISSGVVTKVVEHGSFIELRGEGMNSLFKRRTVTDYTIVGDGSYTYEDILTDATLGLLQGSTSGLLPSAEYQSFDLSTHVVADSENLPTGYSLNYDNISLYDVVVDVCKKAVGGGDRHYDCYLFEMDDADESSKPTLSTASDAYKMCLYFKEKGSTSSSKTLDAGDIDTSSINWVNEKGGEGYFNKVIIRGAFQEVNLCPNNMDFWTEFNEDEENVYDTDIDINDMWSANSSTLTGSTINKVGTYSIDCNIDSNASNSGLNLPLSLADCYNSLYTSDDLFGDESGFKFNQNKEQYIRMWLRVDAGLQAELDGGNCDIVYLLLEGDSGPNVGVPIFGETLMDAAGGFANSDTFSIAFTNPLYAVPPANEWHLIDLRLKDLFNFGVDYIDEIGLVVSYDGGSHSSNDIYIDGLSFYERNYQVSGSATKSGVTTNLKELLIELPELENDDLCEKIATEALKEQDQLQNGGVIPVIGMFKDVDLRAGNTIEISIDSLGLDVRVGASGATSFELEKIVYKPGKQILHVGRNYSVGEMVQAMKDRAFRAFNRLR